MKQKLETILNTNKIMILDGATATELESLGCDLNHELWSAKVLDTNPELFKQVHKSYFEAGADCGISGSYQASIEGFMSKGYTLEESENLIQKSVEILKESREEWWQEEGEKSGRAYPIVCGSVGAYGAFLADGSEYIGNYNVDDNTLLNFHKRRIELLVEAGADILAVETIPCLQEAVVVAKFVQELKEECWICFSCKNESDISDGTKISICAETLNQFDCVKAIGINCTDPNYVGSLIKEIKKNTNKPVIVYPNSGEEYDPVTKTWSVGNLCKNYVDYAREWIDCGAEIVGGCCRTSPKHIKQVYDLVDGQ